MKKLVKDFKKLDTNKRKLKRRTVDFLIKVVNKEIKNTFQMKSWFV